MTGLKPSKLPLKMAPAIIPLDAMPLGPLPHAEPRYDYIFTVEITDADPQKPRCEVRCLPAPNVVQDQLEQKHFEAVKMIGDVVAHQAVDELDLVLYAKNGALIIFYLNDGDTTFFDQFHPNDIDWVIVRDKNQKELLYQPKWLKNTNNGKAISVIMGGYDATRGQVDYGLKLKVVSGRHPSYVDLDPKIENDGEGLYPFT